MCERSCTGPRRLGGYRRSTWLHTWPPASGWRSGSERLRMRTNHGFSRISLFLDCSTSHHRSLRRSCATRPADGVALEKQVKQVTEAFGATEDGALTAAMQ